jgi:hypothetical protein
MTNGLVEVGLISVSVLIGLLGVGFIGLGVMIGGATIWWAFVHHGRFAVLFEASALGALGQGLVALIVLVIGHGLSFVLGRAFRSILGIA